MSEEFYEDIDDEDVVEDDYGDLDVNDPGGDAREGDYDEDETLVAGGEEEQEEVEQAPPQEEQPKPQTQDQAAWNRLAYELRQSQRNQHLMEQRFEQRLYALMNALQPQQQQVEEPLPDMDDEPVPHIVKKLDRLEKTLEQQRLEEQQKEQIGALQQEIAGAVGAARQYREGNPALYDQAMNHLSAVMFEEMAEEYPQLSQTQIFEELSKQASARLVHWQRSGKNPGEELMKLAKRRGFTPQQIQQQAPVQRQQQGTPDARQQVAAAKTRERKGTTISAVKGSAAASAPNTRSWLTMGEDDFNFKVRQLAKQGGRKRVPFAELLKGKGVPDNGVGRFE